MGWRGELTVDGLTWPRNRAFDPGTRCFLSPDPLPPVPGTPVAANPYHYANNDPLNLLDPLGLRPMTDADLAAYRDAHQGFLSDATNWVGDHWGEIVTVVAGAVVLIATATGTGTGTGIGIGILVGAGGNVVGQYAATGEVDWGEVAFKGVTGAISGAAGSVAFNSARVASLGVQLGRSSQPAIAAFARLTPFAVGGAVSASTSSTLSEVRDATRGESFDLGPIVFKTVAGGAFGAGAGTFGVSGYGEGVQRAVSGTGSVWAETVKKFDEAGVAPPTLLGR